VVVTAGAPAGTTGGPAARRGALVGVPFALLAWASALLFRFRSSTTPIAAGAGEALVFAGAWGAAFGALGGWCAHESLRARLGDVLDAVRARSRGAYEGVIAGAVMLLVAAAGAALAGLLWALFVVARGATPRPLTVGGLAGALIFVIAFAPNLVATLLALALGAPIEIGARVRLGARALGPLREYSLADWGGTPTPWYVWLLVLVPLFACLLAGFAARRNTAVPARAYEVLGTSALTFACGAAGLALLARARLGAGLVRPRGFAHVAPDAGATLLWALLWALVVGFAGWRVANAPVRAARPPVQRGDAG
jgi:hypothetical protein